jgi:hypothetical protein
MALHVSILYAVSGTVNIIISCIPTIDLILFELHLQETLVML